MRAFSPDPRVSRVGAVSIPSFFGRRPAPWELRPPMAGQPASQPALPSFPGWVLWGQAPWSPVGPGARGQEPQAHGFACILGKRVPRSQWSQCCGPGWEPGHKGLWGPS